MESNKVLGVVLVGIAVVGLVAIAFEEIRQDIKKQEREIEYRIKKFNLEHDI